MKKLDLLKEPVRHIDIRRINSTKIIETMQEMSFSARDLARASEIYNQMLSDKNCTVALALAGSSSSAGCMQIYADMIKFNMVDVIVATGASIVDMDFFEALGFRHYKGSAYVDDKALRKLHIDRIYDTYIDEDQLQVCDKAVAGIADDMEPGVYSSREFIREMGKYLTKKARKKESLVQLAYENDVPVFCPAFSDSSAGFGLVMHQVQKPDSHVSIDSVKDFRELTEIKIKAKQTGVLIIGGGVPKNFIQDTVVCAEVLGKNVPMHKYAVQITVADVRDGGCSSSTLKEAQSWGKVDAAFEQMVFAEATMAVPLLASYAYHKGSWKTRKRQKLSNLFD